MGGVSIEPRSTSNVAVFSRALTGDEILCATCDRFVLLVELTLDEMQKLVAEYVDEHDKRLAEFLLQPSERVWKGAGRGNVKNPLKIKNQKSPEALAIKVIGSGRKINQVAGRYCSMPALNSAIDNLELWDRLATKPITRAWNIVHAPYSLQRMVCEEMLFGKIQSMEWTHESSEMRHIASSNVVGLMENCKTALAFLERLCGPLTEWFADPKRKGSNGADTRDVRRPLCLAWFAMWLANRGVILFPRNAGYGRGSELLPLRYRHFYATWLRPEESIRTANRYYSKLEKLLARSSSLRSQARSLLATVNLICPGFETGNVAAEVICMLRDEIDFDDESMYVINSMWRLEALELKSKGLSSEELFELNKRVDRRRSHAQEEAAVLWAWVDSADVKLISTAQYARRNQTPGTNLRQHVSNLRDLFPSVAGKSANKISHEVAVWLYFLSTLRDELVPRRVIDVEPKLLSSLRDDVQQSTFRGFLISSKVPSVTQRGAFQALRRMWKVACVEESCDGLICPVSDHLVSQGRRKSERPTSTTHRSIDMELLELLIDENRRDNFAFSREREHRGRLLDHRFVMDPETGQSSLVWWPGVAVLVDLLLQIPIRHKQGRYLDSGEGDEFRLEISSLALEKNELPTATKGRMDAFIQKVSLSPARDEPGLGMFINTNKTGRDYAFPWLREDIASNVQSVIDWQKRFNPIREAVSDRGNSLVEKAANADTVWVYPIFRDPDRHDFQPVSKQIVLDYYRSLMRSVEERYNLQNNTSIRLFRPNGEAVYDIHSLRVTGVTRLLNLGVDVKIVRLLVGHSSLAMTWYYEDITNQRVSSTMERALQSSAPTRELLLGMSDSERSELLARLFNKSSASVARGIDLLATLVAERSPLIDVRIDGICPGAKCNDGNVWRASACSQCPFFVTGAAFLPGLVLRLNNLMAELILHQQRVEQLRESFYESRSRGSPTRAAQAEIRNEEELVDNILAEWEAQLQYVKEAEARLDSWFAKASVSTGDGSFPALISPQPGNLGLALREAHHLELYTNLIEGAKNVDGFVPTIGVREKRDEMLLEIARHARKADLFYMLDPKVRETVLDQFALVVLGDATASVTEISELVGGSTPIVQLSTANRWLDGLSSKGIGVAGI